MATDFGKLLKSYIILKKNDMPHNVVAKEIGYSPTMFSFILNGKKAPDIDFLVKCRDYFELTKDETVAFFKLAFTSSPIISIDTDYFLQDNKDYFIDILTSLLLFPKRIPGTGLDSAFEKAAATFTDAIKQSGELNPMRKANEKG
jgi:transcriptional regulator with XRE-family HTH domain